jgi:antibiotic biosynthesis monooxygenase (ABM) superfamily enzyme
MSELGAGSGPVTVVIAQHVRPEREADYFLWEAKINDACRTFPGFEGIEVVPPVPGVQDDYVVIYRFDTFPHLDAWLTSGTRRALVAEGQSLIVGDARQHVVAGRDAARLSGLVVSTRVKPGMEHEHAAWQKRIDAASAQFPGFLGNEVFPPIPGIQDDWVVIVRFDSPEHLHNWVMSDVRKRLLDEAQRFWDESRVESFSGAFPGWFGAGTSDPGTTGLPPDWKQAMIVLLVLYPIVMILTWFLMPRLASYPLAVAMFIGNAISVALLTWLLMPLANRVFGFWLAPAGRADASREFRGIAMIAAGYALAVAAFLIFG